MSSYRTSMIRFKRNKVKQLGRDMEGVVVRLASIVFFPPSYYGVIAARLPVYFQTWVQTMQ